MVLERPKLLCNLQTGSIVMWMHIDNPDYGWARVGVAVSKTLLALAALSAASGLMIKSQGTSSCGRCCCDT